MRTLAILFTLLFAAPRLAYSQTFTASPTSLNFTFAQGGTLPAHQTIALTATPAASSYAVAITFGSYGGNWLDVTPLSGTTSATAPATLTAQIDPFEASLAAGTYTATIIINQTLKIPVTLTVTSSLVATPALITLNSQQTITSTATTNSIPQAQAIAISSGSAIAFSSTATSVGNWLAITQVGTVAPGTINVSANPAGLSPGSYTGSITVASPAAPSIQIAVILNINAAQMFSFAPTSVIFQSTSAVPYPAAQTVSIFSNSPSSVTATPVTSSGGNWLSATLSGNQTPASLSISINPAALVPGTYTGSINISADAGSVVIPIPVTMILAGAQGPTLQLTPDTVTVSAAQGSAPFQQALAVTNTGGGVLNYTAQITSQSGGNWLALPSPAGAATAGALVQLPLTISPGSLSPGAYRATVTVSGANQTASSLIVLSVAAAGPSLQLSQTGLSFTAVAQGPNPPSQSVAVVDAGSASVNWTVATSILALNSSSTTASWLTATPTSGTTQPAPAAAPVISVTANTQNLSAGTYYGSVKVNTQIISVQCTVLPAGQNIPPSVSANGVIFTAVSGGTNPPSQPVTINNPLAYTSTTSTPDGLNWLSTTPSATSDTVQAAIANLAPAVRSGNTRLGFSDGSTQSINVISVVAPAGTPAQSNVRPVPDAFLPNASGCPSVLIPQVSTVPTGFTANVAQNVPISVMVVDDCGHNLANASSSSVIVSFYDATKPPGPTAKVQPDLRLTPQGNGVWSTTWIPQTTTTQLQMIVVALGINGTIPIAGQTTLNGAVRAAAANAPALPAGIYNAASLLPGNSVASGSFVTIFGSNLADGTATIANGALPLQLQGTQVLLGGVALPLQFAGPNQINALVPAGVTSDTQQPLVIQRDLTQATPISVTIADIQPGIYTLNQQGTGQGAILTSDNSLDAPVGAYAGSHPATRGDFVAIYCTGLGAVNNPPAAGAPASTTVLSRTVATVTATIGGINAPVIFAGLAPGFVGLYQVDVTVPTASTTGGSVPVTITAGGTTSNIATMAIQ